MSWCDKLASTPSVGLRFDTHYSPSSSILAALAPLLDSWIDGDKQRFTVDKNDAFALEVSSEDGFQYGFEPSRLYVEFKHRLKLKAVSGGPPVVEMLSRPRPYTELLPEVSRRVIHSTFLVMPNKSRPIHRIGIVSSTTVAEDEAPPGITRFIKYAARPWQGLVDSYSFQVGSQLGKTSEWSDGCMHNILKSEDGEGLITIKFDWQRTFSKAKPATESSLKGALDSAQCVALEYFEDLAEGNRFDADLIKSTS